MTARHTQTHRHTSTHTVCCIVVVSGLGDDVENDCMTSNDCLTLHIECATVICLQRCVCVMSSLRNTFVYCFGWVKGHSRIWFFSCSSPLADCPALDLDSDVLFILQQLIVPFVVPSAGLSLQHMNATGQAIVPCEFVQRLVSSFLE